MASDLQAAQGVRVAKALGDPMRFRIFREIARRGEMSCAELERRFPISQATVSHHLKVLSQAGLLAVRRDGTFHRYSARTAVLERHLALLGGLIRPAAARARRGS